MAILATATLLGLTLAAIAGVSATIAGGANLVGRRRRQGEPPRPVDAPVSVRRESPMKAMLREWGENRDTLLPMLATGPGVKWLAGDDEIFSVTYRMHISDEGGRRVYRILAESVYGVVIVDGPTPLLQPVGDTA